MECLSISECLYLFLERLQVFIAKVLHLLGQVYSQIIYFLLTFVKESVYTTSFPVYLLLVVYRKGIDVFRLILYPFIIDLPQQADCMWHGRRLWFRQGEFHLKPILSSGCGPRLHLQGIGEGVLREGWGLRWGL